MSRLMDVRFFFREPGNRKRREAGRLAQIARPVSRMPTEPGSHDTYPVINPLANVEYQTKVEKYVSRPH